MKIRLRKKKENEESVEGSIQDSTDDIEMAEAEETDSPEKNAGEEEEDKKRGAGLILRRRALMRATRRVLQARKANLFLAALALFLALVFIFATVQERMGNFTININRMDMYRQGIMLADNKAFEKPTSRLVADAVKNATNISIVDLPKNLWKKDGKHNGKDYMAYTFYIRNGGREMVDYYSNITIEMEAKGVTEAVRVAVYDEKGNRKIYAKPAKNGKAEPGTIPFVKKDIVMEDYVRNFEVNDVDKYTVVIWLEGDDPECVDAIIGGMVRMAMNIEIADPIKDR